jgi:hypothetical protein
MTLYTPHVDPFYDQCYQISRRANLLDRRKTNATEYRVWNLNEKLFEKYLSVIYFNKNAK